MIKTTTPTTTKSKVVTVKDVWIENGTIVDDDGAIIECLVKEIGDNTFSFKVTLPVVEEEGNEEKLPVKKNLQNTDWIATRLKKC